MDRLTVPSVLQHGLGGIGKRSGPPESVFSVVTQFMVAAVSDTIHGGNCQRRGYPRGMLLEHSNGWLQTEATSTMNSATTLMTSLVWPASNRSNIDHELCHYTDDVTRMTGFKPKQA
jgi:hypothetical protein